MDNLKQRIDMFRRFNRFYTNKIGVLAPHMHDTPFSLSEARVLYELGRDDNLTAGELVRRLVMDPGYLSRMLTSFSNAGLITRTRSKADGRQRMLNLTTRGRRMFSVLNKRASIQAKQILDQLAANDQERLLRAMEAIELILSERQTEGTPVVLRTHRSGDIGWITERHGIVYSDEYQFDETFEALVAEILANVIKSYDHKRDHIWIAEVDGDRAGTITATAASDSIVQLRLFLVEPWARCKGIGKLLIKECIRFGRLAGYKKMRLWTQSTLVAARKIYEDSDFKLVNKEAHHSFGRDLIGETWELKLR